MSVQLLTLFKKNLVSFFDELIETFPNEKEFILIRVVLKDQVPIQDVMNHFINHILPVKDRIKQRDETLFTDSDVFYFGLDQLGCKGIKGVWVEGKLDDDNKNVIWQWLDSFIAIVEKYKKSM
jgi:hypothetical protein